MSNYIVLSYYSFFNIENPVLQVEQHKLYCAGLDILGRIYIADNGVNGQVSVHSSAITSYLNWLETNWNITKNNYKIQRYNEHAFAKLQVKLRKELVAIDKEINLKNRGKYLSPIEWVRALEEKDENTILIDVRNNYESKVGHFTGAILPPLDTFRKFPQYAEQLQRTYDPESTKVLMYCTGGIRCELFSSLLQEKGFKSVFQLQGGVIQYGNEVGRKYWKGNLFVFDDRLVVPIDRVPNEPISQCSFCMAASDIYYNCANPKCNELFLACISCAAHNLGCCSGSCKSSGKNRVFKDLGRPKPFRKLTYDEKQALSHSS